jgi:lipoyl(octanoyl) transferase
MNLQNIITHPLKQCEYQTAWDAMRDFTDMRDSNTSDEIWLIEHPPVYTLGQNGKREHILNPGNIPIIQTDRGGQVTYHGPGQLMFYVLVDLRRRNMGIRDLVSSLEKSVINMLAELNITAKARPDAPGVYVDDAKICSLGLRVRRGCSYHGLALNVSMDLAPFTGINPCGYANLAMTQIADWGRIETLEDIAKILVKHFSQEMSVKFPLK